MPTSVSTPEWLVPVMVVAAYGVGSLSPGWWLVRRKAGVDLRNEGSGATGATNAARILGRKAYIVVMSLDALKGLAAVGLARWLAPDRPWALLAAPAVVAGHIWPVWLGFRGGRGAATLLGVCLALNPWLAPAAFVPGLLAGLRARKGFVVRAVAFLASLPIGWALLPGTPARVSLTLAWLMVLLAHRSYFGKTLPQNRITGQPTP